MTLIRTMVAIHFPCCIPGSRARSSGTLWQLIMFVTVAFPEDARLLIVGSWIVARYARLAFLLRGGGHGVASCWSSLAEDGLFVDLLADLEEVSCDVTGVPHTQSSGAFHWRLVGREAA